MAQAFLKDGPLDGVKIEIPPTVKGMIWDTVEVTVSDMRYVYALTNYTLDGLWACFTYEE